MQETNMAFSTSPNQRTAKESTGIWFQPVHDVYLVKSINPGLTAVEKDPFHINKNNAKPGLDIPPGSIDLGSVLRRAMWNDAVVDIERIDQILPRIEIKMENRLMLLRARSLLVPRSSFKWDYRMSA